MNCSSPALHFLVGQVGIEPTVFLMSRFYRPLHSPAMRTDPYWWNRLELNQRHPELQSGALPTELRFHVAESAELESDAGYGTIRLAGGPQTFWVHSPNSGWDGWIRTNDAGVRDRCLTTWLHPNMWRGQSDLNTRRRFWRPLLYQLSYTPEW